VREPGVRQGVRELDLPLAADVVEDDGIPASDPAQGFPAPIDEDEGLQGLLLLAALVGFTNGGREG